jgi:pyruvate ferredoxin oxidoreductase gamma subunit/2-oxoisovalerate ferredoxin oxidoreductase gamma subunit
VLLHAIDVTAGLRPDGWILVNAARQPEELGLPDRFSVATCDATAIALRHGLGTRTSPIVNTAIVGAFSALTGLVDLASVVEMIPDLVPVKAKANQAAAREAFTLVHRRPALAIAGVPGTRA